MEYHQSQPQIDYRQLSLELLKAVRGRRAQSILSQRLGRSANYVYRLENGYRDITWIGFLEFCEVCGVNLNGFFSALHYEGERRDGGALIRHLLGRTSNRLGSRYLSMTGSKLSRLKTGSTQPKLFEMLQFIQFFQSRLVIALEHLVRGKEQLPALESYRRVREQEIALHFEAPESAALTIALNLEKYSQASVPDSNLLSEATGIPRSQVGKLLHQLHSAGVIQKDGMHYRYVPKAIEVDGTLQQHIKLRKYWLDRARSKLDQVAKTDKKGASLFGYNVFTLNKTRYQRVFEQYFKAYHDLVKAAVHTDGVGSQEPGEKALFCLGIQLVCLQEDEPNFRD